MSLLIISGISGSGKSTVCNTLEDIGYFCIDNLPPQLLLPVAKLQSEGQTKNTAIVIDSRSSRKFDTFLSELDELDKNGIEHKLVFIYTEPDVILNRYKQTRRRHPLADSHKSLEEAIDAEYRMCQPIQEKADIEIDTTYLNIRQLREYVEDMFIESNWEGLTVKIVSFGYRNGIPNEADLVFDVRCLPNPFYIPELKNHSGDEDCVYDYVFSFEQSKIMGEKILDFLKYFLPYYDEEGKTELVVAVGCTSGHHRSVSFVRYLEEHLKDTNYQIITMNRDINKEF